MLNSSFSVPKVMAILNVTPDSFSDGGNYYSDKLAIDRALELIDIGADIIDIGGESTRPGSLPVSAQDEISRVIPIVEAIKKLRPDAFISVDTMKYEVAKAATDCGANMINDVTGLVYNENIAELAAKYDLDLVIMHIKGMPKDMQNQPQYDDVVQEVKNELIRKVEIAKNYGVSKITIDPGIGFGKTYEHNLKLLANLDELNSINLPILLGISRKAFLGKMFDLTKPSTRDIPTIIFHSLLNTNVQIIRVHNIEYALQMKKSLEELAKYR